MKKLAYMMKHQKVLQVIQPQGQNHFPNDRHSENIGEHSCVNLASEVISILLWISFM